MRSVHEITEIIARAETTRWRIKTGRLVAPTAVKRVLVHRHQFDVGEPHPFHVRDELIGEFPVAQPEIVVGMTTPRPQMHFIDGDWRIELVGFFTRLGLFHFFGQTANERGRFRTHLRLKGVRVGFNPQVAVGVDHLIFIELTMLRARDEQFPDSALFAQTHRVTATIPEVKLSDHRNATCVRCPDGETSPRDAIHRVSMGTQGFIRTQMGAFRQQPGIHILNQGTKTVGIINQILLAMPDYSELVAKRIFTTR